MCIICIMETKGDKSMTFWELEKILTKDGWRLKSIKGSHFQYIHDTKLGKITIHCHKSDIKKGTADSILKQAGLK